MGQQYRLKDGTLVESRPGGGYQEVFNSPASVGGGDPRLPYQTQSARNAADASGYDPRIKQADAVIKAAEATNAQALQNAKTREAEANAKTAELNQGGKTIDPGERSKAIKDYEMAQSLRQMVANMSEKFQAGPGSTSGVRGFTDYLPYTANQQFDIAGNKARGLVGQALGFTGGQLNTQQEAEKAIGPYLPQSDDRDSVAMDKMTTLGQLADQAESRAVAILGGRPDANGKITPTEQMDKSAGLMGNGEASGGNVLSKDGTQTVDDPLLKRIGQHATRMAMKPGASQKQIDSYLQANGVPPGTVNVSDLFKWKTSPGGAEWIRQNPGQAFPLDPKFYKKQVPLSESRAFWNSNAQKPGGAAVGAFANSLVAGQLPNIIGATGGNADLARSGMDMVRAENPLMSMAGDIAGQAANEAIFGRIPGASKLLSSPWGRRGYEAAYGGTTGGANGGDLASVAEGALFNAGGGMVGRTAQRGIGGALTGVKDASLKLLNERGIPLTVGRIGRGSPGRLGQFVGGVEERMMGLPGPDAMIGAARRRGDVGFNEAVSREMGGTGQTGAAAITENQGLENRAFGFLDNSQMGLDAQYGGGQAAVRSLLPGLPTNGPEIGRAMDILDQQSAGGALSGRDWQSALRAARGDRASIAGTPFGEHAVGALNNVEDNLMRLADRQGPPGALADLQRANTLHAQAQTVARALDNGPSQRAGELFSPTTLDAASRQARNFGGRVSSLKGNRPFYELTKAALESMPNLTPDSGSIGRMAIIPAVGGALGGAEGLLTGNDGNRSENTMHRALQGAMLGATLEGLYSKPGQSVIQKALLNERPKAVSAFGQWLIDNVGLLGKAGSGVARSAIYPQQP